MDGIEIFGIFFIKKLFFLVGEFVMFINVFIFIWVGFVYGLEQVMYFFMIYYIVMKMIDVVIQGFDEMKVVIIVVDQYVEILDVILYWFGWGIIKFQGKGGYMDEFKEVIYVVVIRFEVIKLKFIVFEIDKNVFIIIMNIYEMRGGKFKIVIYQVFVYFLLFYRYNFIQYRKMVCCLDSCYFFFGVIL